MASAKKKRAIKRTRTKSAKQAGKRPRPAKPSARKKPAAKKRRGAPIDRLRAICLALPESAEVEAWGAPTFRVKGKIFAMYVPAGGHYGPRDAAWIMSVSMEQDLVLHARPDRYFKPPYVGPSGWIGAWLDSRSPWDEIAELVRDGWRRRAPKRLAAQLPD